MTLKVRILPFLTTFVQLSARLKNFLGGWLLVFGIKEGLVECATVCVKSVVILNSILSLLCSPINTLAPCAKHNVHTKTRWIDLANQLVIVIIQTHHHLQNPVKFLWLRSYRSDFLRRLLKVLKISQLVWRLLSKFQINWDVLSSFCGLLRKLKKMPCAWFSLKSFLSLSFFSTYVKGFLKKYPSLFKISCLLSVYNRGSFVKFLWPS